MLGLDEMPYFMPAEGCTQGTAGVYFSVVSRGHGWGLGRSRWPASPYMAVAVCRLELHVCG